jgi:hypothetical protein
VLTPQEAPSRAALNIPAVANAGAALFTTSCGALGKLILDGSTCGAHLALGPVALCFAGILTGGVLMFLGRPSPKAGLS